LHKKKRGLYLSCLTEILNTYLRVWRRAEHLQRILLKANPSYLVENLDRLNVLFDVASELTSCPETEAIYLILDKVYIVAGLYFYNHVAMMKHKRMRDEEDRHIPTELVHAERVQKLSSSEIKQLVLIAMTNPEVAFVGSSVVLARLGLYHLAFQMDYAYRQPSISDLNTTVALEKKRKYTRYRRITPLRYTFSLDVSALQDPDPLTERILSRLLKLESKYGWGAPKLYDINIDVTSVWGLGASDHDIHSILHAIKVLLSESSSFLKFVLRAWEFLKLANAV
jgi:hypothetical protein